MSEDKFKYRIEMRAGQDLRFIDADSYGCVEGWIIFYRKAPQGGPGKEFWRVKTDDVVSLETIS